MPWGTLPRPSPRVMPLVQRPWPPFSSLAMRAVGKAAFYVIKDVRDQFRENPGILAGTVRPNYSRTVDIVTVGALKEMVYPGFLAVGMPIAVGLVFRMFGLGAEAVAAFQIGRAS